VSGTPLDAFTFVDIVRATLGVGPCEYILDVEGQKKQAEGRPTCASRTILNTIYANKEQKAKRAEAEQALRDVLAFMQHIRTRIEGYATFGRQTLAWLDEQKKAKPELAPFIAEMEALTRRIDEAVEKRKDKILAPERAAELVDEFRKTVLSDESNGALDACKKITAGFVGIGGAQDELVGECRAAVKVLRQRAAISMAVDPRTAAIAKELRNRTQTMLRNPTSYEAPRH
jgi:ATP-dependent exoDNAse (exonuclease V) alpha subunit